MRVIALVVLALGGCVPQAAQDAASSDEITSPAATVIGRKQSIGNCWLYASTSWAEALVRLRQPTADPDFSEAYLSYWWWYEQLAVGATPRELRSYKKLVTGGWQSSARGLIGKYGMMNELDFGETLLDKRSEPLAKRALAKVQAALANGQVFLQGTLPGRVRDVLDEAWELRGSTVSDLDRVFGRDIHRDLTDPRATAASATTLVQPATTIAIAYADGSSATTSSEHTLADALSSFSEVLYPREVAARRAAQRRIQRVLMHGIPVPNEWAVDDTYDRDASFRRPGRVVGHHGTLIVDYDAEVPGYGHLPAGKVETRPDALLASLGDDTHINFFRVKNWWSDPSFEPGRDKLDLYLSYLDAPTRSASEAELVPDDDDVTPSTVDASEAKGAPPAPSDRPHLVRVTLPSGF